MAKPIDAGGKGKGKAKGKVRVPLCVISDDTGLYELKEVPSPSVAGRVADEGAVYPVDGMCPIDPPVFEDDSEEV
jgi:hypothetical protein